MVSTARLLEQQCTTATTGQYSYFHRFPLDFNPPLELIPNKIMGFEFILHNVFVVHHRSLNQVRNMTWYQFMEDHFTRLTLIFWFISSFLVLFLLGQLDWIIHDKLYEFDLQFSLTWAQPYWITLRLIHIWIVGPSILGAIALGFDLWKRKAKNRKRIPRHKSKSKSAAVTVQPPKDNSMLISCPSCQKTFSKPLVMLDFSSRKAKLVNVCPYCNAKLGDADEEENDLETEIVSPDEEVRMS